MKSVFNTDSKFDMPKPTANDINKIIKSLDINKATGPDDILAKFVQMSAIVIACHLSTIAACGISENKYSEHAKTATIRPIFKTNFRTKIENCRSVSLLNMFCQIKESILHENLTFLSRFISAYRKSSNHAAIAPIMSYRNSSNHVLIH